MGTKRIIGWGLFLLLVVIGASLIANQASAQGDKLNMTWGKLPGTWGGRDCSNMSMVTPDPLSTSVNREACDWSKGGRKIAVPMSYVFADRGMTLLKDYQVVIGIYSDPRAFPSSLDEYRDRVKTEGLPLDSGSDNKFSAIKFAGCPALKFVWDPPKQGVRIEEYVINLGTMRVGISVIESFVASKPWPDGQLKEEVAAILASLRFVGANCSAPAASPSKTPTPALSPCTATVRGLSPQKPGDVISPGATYRDASGKEVGIIQERWYFNGKETTSIVWDGKKVTVEHQWTCLDHSPHSQTHAIAAYQSAPPPPGEAGAPPTSGGGEIVDSPVPGLGNVGSVPGPKSVPEGVVGVVLPGLIAIGVSILGGILGGGPKGPVTPPAGAGGAAPLPPAKPPVLPIPTPPAAVPFPAAPPVAGGTVVLPPAGPPSPAGTPAKPAPASPEDKQKAKAEIRQKQEEAIKEHDKATAEGDRWGWWEDLAGKIKSGADLGVNILSTVTGPAGKSIKSGYDTLSVIADHTGGAIADGNVRDHAIGAITDVASGKATDLMTSKVGDAAGWAGGKLADKIGKALPGQIKQTVAGGIDSISNKILGTGNTSYGSSLDLGGATVTKTLKSIFGTGDLSGQVRTKIWEAGKDQATDWAKGKASDQFIKQTTGGKIEDADDYKKKLSDIAQATINDKLDSWGRKPKPGVERFR